jgi:hypothetical protein
MKHDNLLRDASDQSKVVCDEQETQSSIPLQAAQ